MFCMKKNDVLNRRDVLVALSALAALGGGSAEGQSAAGKPSLPGEQTLSHSHVFPFDSLPVKPSVNGGASRAVTHGALAPGEDAAGCESTRRPGPMRHPPHKRRLAAVL